MDKDAKIYVAGHRGLLGKALVRMLRERGYENLLLRSSAELDLRRQADVEAFFEQERPQVVFLAAARVGGIWANMHNPAPFLYDNVMIQTNVIHAAWRFGTERLLFVSSSCSYPRICPQPMREEFILTGPPEPTNESYAIAKISGMKMIEAYHRQYGVRFFSVIFPNLYGPGDNFDPRDSHVIAALVRRFHEAAAGNRPEVEIWGTGRARREFLYVDDAADACLFFIDRLSGGEAVNAGAGSDVSIGDLAGLIARISGYRGRLIFDPTKPDGMPQKLLDVSNIERLGWKPRVGLEEGLRKTCEWYARHGAAGEKP
ncbi:MAG: GDP-L-fucose synthase [Syntrophaceae bacterium]|nr:GDP-L-fucose synthase [Syntrophaceae bacterium]